LEGANDDLVKGDSISGVQSWGFGTWGLCRSDSEVGRALARRGGESDLSRYGEEEPVSEIPFPTAARLALRGWSPWLSEASCISISTLSLGVSIFNPRSSEIEPGGPPGDAKGRFACEG
jgi:hypothetical protein